MKLAIRHITQLQIGQSGLLLNKQIFTNIYRWSQSYMSSCQIQWDLCFLKLSLWNARHCKSNLKIGFASWLTWVMFKAVLSMLKYGEQNRSVMSIMHKVQFSMIRMAMLTNHFLQDLSLNL